MNHVLIQHIQGFNAINGSELAGAEDSGLTYYQVIMGINPVIPSITLLQVWNGSDWTLNDGPQGLQRLDHVINTAAKHDIKIILTFTNNWYVYFRGSCLSRKEFNSIKCSGLDTGSVHNRPPEKPSLMNDQGAELYINWIAGAGNTHDVFYTDSRIISSYREQQ